MKMSFFGGKNVFFGDFIEKPSQKYPNSTGITPKITNPTLHLGEKVRCRLAFLAIFGPFRGHGLAKNSPKSPKSPPAISYVCTLMVLAKKTNIQDPWLKNVDLGWNGPGALVPDTWRWPPCYCVAR